MLDQAWRGLVQAARGLSRRPGFALGAIPTLGVALGGRAAAHRGALPLLPKPEGFPLETADSPAAVLAAVESRELDVVLIDLNYTRDTTSGREGMDLLSRLQAIDPTLPVVVMTAWGSGDVGGGG